MAGDRKGGPIDFTTFVMGLGASAFMHLGEAPAPEGGEVKPDLDLAQQVIDILGMLEEKTKDNLTEAEASFLEGLLRDLRLRFVAKRTGGA